MLVRLSVFLVCSVFLFSACQPMAKKKSAVVSEVEASKTQEASDGNDGMQSVACEWNGDKREIFVREREIGGCEVVYVKSEEQRVVANARNELAYCDRVVSRIKTNLLEAGFDCVEA